LDRRRYIHIREFTAVDLLCRFGTASVRTGVVVVAVNCCYEMTALGKNKSIVIMICQVIFIPGMTCTDGKLLPKGVGLGERF